MLSLEASYESNIEGVSYVVGSYVANIPAWFYIHDATKVSTNITMYLDVSTNLTHI